MLWVLFGFLSLSVRGLIDSQYSKGVCINHLFYYTFYRLKFPILWRIERIILFGVFLDLKFSVSFS